MAASLARAQGAKALRDILVREQCGVSNQAKQACSAYAKQEKWLFRSPRLFSAEAAELDDGSKALERARRSSLWHQRITLLGAWPRAIKYVDCALSTSWSPIRDQGKPCTGLAGLQYAILRDSLLHMQVLLRLAQELCTYTRQVKHPRSFSRRAFSQRPSFPLALQILHQNPASGWQVVVLTAQRVHGRFTVSSICRIWLTRNCCTRIIWSTGPTPTSATLSACMSPKQWRSWSTSWQRPMRRVRALSLITLVTKLNVGSRRCEPWSTSWQRPMRKAFS